MSDETPPATPEPGLVAALEERAFAAWPAEEVQVIDGWRLRHMRGVTRRANSVWPGTAESVAAPRPLTARLAEVERFYAERGQPAMFQLSPVAAPPALDAALAERGYAIDAPVEVQVADVGTVLARCPPGPGARTQIASAASASWFEVSALRGRFAAVAEVYRGLLERLAGRAVYALAERDGIAAAVALGVVDRGWMGIFAMFTLPEQRRQRLGAAALAALAAAARDRQIDRLYLQVEVDNAAARALYAGAGFHTAYRYHYRVAPRA